MNTPIRTAEDVGAFLAIVKYLVEPNAMEELAKAQARSERLVAGLPRTAPTKILWAPEGMIDIHPASIESPTWRGQMCVDEVSAINLQVSLKECLAAGERPVIDLRHRKDAVAGYVNSFEWLPGVGIAASVEWSPLGRIAVENRYFNYISPTSELNAESGRIIRLAAGHTAAGLTNTPGLTGAVPLLTGARIVACSALRKALHAFDGALSENADDMAAFCAKTFPPEQVAAYANLLRQHSPTGQRGTVVHARANFNAQVLAADRRVPSRFCWMPKGVHSIAAGTADGAGYRGSVICDEQGANAVRQSFAELTREGRRVFVDFNHAGAEAAAWVWSFDWDPAVGIVCSCEWTAAGEKAILDEVYTSFSPSFWINYETNRVAGLHDVACGGLVNRPAFGAAMPQLMS